MPPKVTADTGFDALSQGIEGYLTRPVNPYADTLLLTVPNQLGVDYNAHVIESILKFVAPELGWR